MNKQVIEFLEDKFFMDENPIMKMSKDVRKQIVEGFVDLFPQLSNIEYQRRVWINGEGPEADAFDDTANSFLLECDSIIDNYKEFGITESQYQILKTFIDRFKMFCDENDFPEEFIDTPEWGEITEMAKQVLKAFNYKGGAHGDRLGR